MANFSFNRKSPIRFSKPIKGKINTDRKNLVDKILTPLQAILVGEFFNLLILKDSQNSRRNI